MWSTVLTVLTVGCSSVGAVAVDPSSASLASLARLNFTQLAPVVGGSDDPVPFLDMPAQFSSAILLSQTSDSWNQTFSGTIWGSTPTKQQRLSGT